MILVYFATEVEARVALQQKKAGYLIMVGGMGLLAACQSISSHISFVEEVWNLGIAGSLRSTRLGQTFEVSSVRRAQLFPEGLESRSRHLHADLHPHISLQEKGQTLVTCDYPIHQRELREQLALDAELVDMEGYGVAYMAQRFNKRCRIWKVVSDFAGPGGPERIQEQLEMASQQLAELL